jgi:hypothetical protein
MHAPGFSFLSASPCSRKHFSPAASQDRACSYRSRVRWLFSGLAILVLLVSCSRAAYAATFTVTDTSDNASDTGSLRYAVNTAVDGDTIAFADSVIGTITLANGPLAVMTNVIIEGPGPVLLTISGNNASPVFQIYAAGTVNLSGLTIANGSSSNNGGGIDHIYTSGTLLVNACAFTANATAAGGGAIANGGGTLTVQNTTFSGNSGQVGGAVFNNSGTTAIENSTFFNNSASGGPGGGIFNNGAMTIDNSTLTGNVGGGFSNNNGGPTIAISNSIIAGNSSYDCNNCGTQTSTNMFGGTPDLGPFQFNGGDTETMMPLPGSAAIGAGTGNTTAVDQRGFARSTSGATDLGAVQTKYLTVTTLSDSTDAGSCTGGATCSLRDAINLANSDGSGDIVFQSGLTGSITLTGILPSITADTNIAGPGALRMTISADGSNSSVMDISSTSARVNLSGVTISHSYDMTTEMAAVSNSGTLSIENSVFSYNTGQNGGAIFNTGLLGVENATFSDNVATYGGGIDNQGRLVVANSTFVRNRAYNGNGGGVESSGQGMVIDSTFTGNQVLNGAMGGGMDSSAGLLTVSNTIITGNTNVDTSAEDDCHNCTQTGPLLTAGVDPHLGQLSYNGFGSLVPTMVPLPGSPAIQAGDATQLPVGLRDDGRGFPRLTAGKLDLGAVQTNYTSIAFVQQPSDAFFNTIISPAVTVEILETNNNRTAPNNTNAVGNVPLTLSLNGSGTLGGTLTQTTSGVASFGDLKVSTPGTGDTLSTSITITPTGVSPAQTLTATSNPFDVTLVTSTVSFNPPLPASVTYGVAPLTLKATAVSSGTVTGQIVNFHVDSGPATVNGNVLTITGAGTVVVEVDATGTATYAASSATSSITVMQVASQLALTASSAEAPVGGSVTLTATATSSSGTPTGTVTFLSGGTTLGTGTLNAQGVATLAVSTLPVGSNTITATYPGDTNFSGSQAQLTGTIVVGTPGFSMTSSGVSLSVKSGSTGNLTLTLTPTFGYTGTLSFSCTGMPGTSTCAFQPAAVQFDGSGNPVQVTVSMQIVTTQSQSRSAQVAKLLPIIPLGGLPILPAAVLWFPETDDLSDLRIAGVSEGSTRSRSHRWIRIGMLVLFAMGLLGMLFGCGGQAVKATGGQYTVTIMATGAGAGSQSIAVQLTVTP